jgi:hypothetical protein
MIHRKAGRRHPDLREKLHPCSHAQSVAVLLRDIMSDSPCYPCRPCYEQYSFSIAIVTPQMDA